MPNTLQLRPRGLNIIPSAGAAPITPPSGTGVVEVVGGVFTDPARTILVILAANGLIFVTASVSTTDATVTTILTYAIPTGKTVTVNGTVSAVTSTASAGSGWPVTASWRNNAGTVTTIGCLATPTDGATTWDVTATQSGTNGLVQVTGQAATNITWAFTGQITVTA